MTFIIVLACVIFGVGCSTSQSSSSDDQNTTPENIFVYQNGRLVFEDNQDYDAYQVYVQDKLFTTTKENEYDIARAIIDSQPLPYGEWEIEVVGVAEGGKVVKQLAQKFSLQIKQLNASNFVSALNGEYDQNDYFLMSENIYLYGRGQYNTKNVDGYKTVTLGAPVAESACFFIDKPFTATLDGNGYALDILVDEHISWVELPFVFGGIFYNIAQSGVVKNTQFFLDLKYENKSRPDSSASFVYLLDGKITDCFIDGVFRPFIRLSLEECRLQGIKYDDAPYLKIEDNKIAVVSKATDGAAIENTVFQIAIFDLEGVEKIGGGAVSFSVQNVSYENCILISRGETRFFNSGYSTANAKSQTPSYSENIYFYNDYESLISMQGYKVNGELSRTPQYSFYENNAFDGLSRWGIMDGELYLLNKVIITD